MGCGMSDESAPESVTRRKNADHLHLSRVVDICCVVERASQRADGDMVRLAAAEKERISPLRKVRRGHGQHLRLYLEIGAAPTWEGQPLDSFTKHGLPSTVRYWMCSRYSAVSIAMLTQRPGVAAGPVASRRERPHRMG